MENVAQVRFQPVKRRTLLCPVVSRSEGALSNLTSDRRQNTGEYRRVSTAANA
jgi:hypothetical protein